MVFGFSIASLHKRRSRSRYGGGTRTVAAVRVQTSEKNQFFDMCVGNIIVTCDGCFDLVEQQKYIILSR